MARFSGTVGFLKTKETDPKNHPGVWTEVLAERRYFGDVLSSSRRWDQNGSASLNDNLTINNRISIVADRFAKENLGAMKFVRWFGDTWEITNVELQYPRIILTIGGQYHEPEELKKCPRRTEWECDK